MFKDKPSDLHQCRFCLFKRGPVLQDDIDPNIKRYYCIKRYAEVDTQKMAGYCHFYKLDPSIIPDGEADVII